MNRLHYGHERFFRLLLDDQCPIPLTLLVARVKEEPACPSCDCSLLAEIQSQGVMEVGLHVHPALSRFPYERQRRIISDEWNRMVEGTGIMPKTFSGGHWCINANTLKIVRQLGMVVDASVVPGCGVMAYNGARLRYSDNFTEPYWVSTEQLDAADPASDLLEMPVSIRPRSSIVDLTTTGFWDILDFFSTMARQKRDRHYLHMTFHSYDVLMPDGKMNFFYDKIKYAVDRLNGIFNEVNLRTCWSCYLQMNRERAL
ncbi:MAG: hypothetical protein WC683_10595 [bacterium]